MRFLMEKNSTNPAIEIVYQTLELLDEAVHYSNVDLVREINKLKKENYERN